MFQEIKEKIIDEIPKKKNLRELVDYLEAEYLELKGRL
tara:strand:+ start:49 stop:162 length:114 start_codon:yes stop_codon:yes gene_type:complete